MSWFDTKQAAVDPDNPAANEQIPFSEWNAMVTYLKDKIVDKTVNTAAIGDDKVLVYKTATSTFVFEAQSGGAGAINDLTDVTISGVPADNEVLAYDTGTSEWINQTAAEAGLATVAGLASYLALAGGTMAGTLNMGDYLIDDVDDIQANDSGGIRCRDSVGTVNFTCAQTAVSFVAGANGSMNNNRLVLVTDPTSAQDASTKNYDDTHLFTKEAVTSFTDGYVPVYRTASGKFEMEAGGGSAGLPVVDTTAIVKGSADGTKLMRFEVDGLTTGTTRVATMPDKDITLCGTAEVMLLSGTQAMTANLDMDANKIINTNTIQAGGDTEKLAILTSNNPSGTVDVYGRSHASYPGQVRFYTPVVSGAATVCSGYFEGMDNEPKLVLTYGLDMNDTVIADMKNSAPTALSGTQKDIEIDIGGTPYYFTVYPTKA